MKIKKRLQLNAVVSIASALLICLMLFVTMQRINRNMEASKCADQLLINIFERSTFREDYLRTNSERSKVQWFSRHEQISGLLKYAAMIFTDSDNQKIVGEMIKDQETTGKLFSAIVANRDKAGSGSGQDVLSQDIESRLLTQLIIRLYDKTMNVRKLQAASNKSLDSALRQMNVGIFFVLLLVGVAMMMNSWSLSRTISDRIGLLRDGATIVGGGDLKHLIDIRGDDEFVELSEAFNSMTVKLRGSYLDLEKEIEERKQAEELLRESRADLARAQKVGGIGSWRLNVRLNELTWSDETYSIFGIPKGTPLSYESFLNNIHPEDRVYVDAQWLAALGGEPYDIEHRIVVDGKVKWVREKAFLELAGPDNLLGGFGIVQDITQRKEVEEELRKAHDELEMRVRKRTEELAESLENQRQEMIERERAEILLHQETLARLHAVEALREKEQMLIQQSRQAAMGEMIGNIAHQWRQPLNALGLLTQRLGLFFGTPNFNKELLDTSIAKSMEIIQHMSKTIDDFSNYFKPDKEKTDFRVGDVIKNTLSLLEGSFQNPRIRITIETNDNPVINGFQNEFAQVLLNILINARDAIIEREIVDAEVAIAIRSEDDCTVVTISDNAGGIPEAIINKVFDPYFTTKGPQKGTGVGLFMSKSIIEKNMGGKLTVRNTDTGAEFRIEV